MKYIVIIHDAEVNVYKNQSILYITMVWVKYMI